MCKAFLPFFPIFFIRFCPLCHLFLKYLKPQVWQSPSLPYWCLCDCETSNFAKVCLQLYPPCTLPFTSLSEIPVRSVMEHISLLLPNSIITAPPRTHQITLSPLKVTSALQSFISDNELTKAWPRSRPSQFQCAGGLVECWSCGVLTLAAAVGMYQVPKPVQWKPRQQHKQPENQEQENIC